MLNNFKDGDKLQLKDVSTRRSVPVVGTKPAGAAKQTTMSTPAKKALTYAEIEPLLVKNTCTACHQVNKRQVGPAFADVSKRKYSDEKILELIYTPQPKNWPEYATPMAAMPQVSKEDALKIAGWINSLRDLK
jgi:cytochrome c551/c552